MTKYLLRELGAAESASATPESVDGILVTITSKRLLAAMERNAGYLDTTIMDLVMQWVGDYQDPKQASNWNMRHSTYGSNARRSLAKERMERWMSDQPLKRFEKE